MAQVFHDADLGIVATARMGSWVSAANATPMLERREARQRALIEGVGKEFRTMMTFLVSKSPRGAK